MDGVHQYDVVLLFGIRVGTLVAFHDGLLSMDQIRPLRLDPVAHSEQQLSRWMGSLLFVDGDGAGRSDGDVSLWCY